MSSCQSIWLTLSSVNELAGNVYDHFGICTARRTGDILLEQNPTKQVEILDEVLRLQKQLKINQEIEDVAINQSIRLGTQQIPKLINE